MTTLKDLYVEELQDLWSANDQMEKVVAQMAEKATATKLAANLKKSKDGIGQHTALLKSLLEDSGADVKKEHCKGMAGLAAEASKHALETNLQGAVLDVALIAQYQRMCHYGIAGFGTTKAFAEALGLKDAARKLDGALKHIYQSDEYATQLAEHSRNAQAV